MKAPNRTRIIVCGAGGKMGSLILSLAQQRNNFIIAGAVEQPGHTLIGHDAGGVKITAQIPRLPEGRAVVMDFTTAESALVNLAAAKTAGYPILIGTTGFSSAQRAEITAAAAAIPVLLAANMSYGVNSFFEIVRRAAQMLGAYDIEIMETHHHHKKDAPSGTAKEIAGIVCRETGRDPEKALVFGRSGIPGERTWEEIGVHALRLGDVVGEHSVFFGGRGEMIELTHRCYNREALASGALDAARFLDGKPAKLYTMEDVIKCRT